MSLGCPVVAFNCDFGPREIIEHGINGLLVAQGDIDALSISLFQLAHDEVLRRQFAESGMGRIGDFAINTISTRWLAA
jgi:glycosyltransferase involved in cell wall biosynthesis